MTKQSGNMLFILLICIALLGGLAALLTRSSGSSDDTGSAEQDSIIASNILKYAAGVQTATQSLIARGCSENQLNFAHATNQNPANPNAAPNNVCDIYHPAGAGLSYKRLPLGALANSNSSNPHLLYQSHWHTDHSHCVWGVGRGTTTCLASEQDLRLVIVGIKKSVCDQINRTLGINSATTPNDSESVNQFIGTFTVTAEGLGQRRIGDTSPSFVLQGRKAGCYMDTDGTGTGWYGFYQVLIVR